jgi:hypothetical protein
LNLQSEVAVKTTSNIKGHLHTADGDVPFANVVVNKTTTKNNILTGTSANEKGGFKLELEPGVYDFNISCIGYEKKTLTVTVVGGKELDLGTIELKENAKVIRCGFIIKDMVTTEAVAAATETEKSSQGPITGLEGHNFIEDPAIIYPNPVKDVMNIKSTDPITVIEILNIHGQVEKIFHGNDLLDVSTLAAGTYYARISFENIKKVQVEKILVVK